MALNDIDDVYGTQDQVEFARRMAESLLKGGGYVPDASMAVLPGTWAYGAGNVLKALAGNQYRGIAGSQDKALSDRMLDPNAPNTAKNLRNSQIRNQTRPTAPQAMRHDYGGGNPDAYGAEPSSGDYYKNEVKKSENEPLFSGKRTRDRSVWDYKQHSIGFGTRSKPGEIIDVAEAHKRFDTEWSKAQDEVDNFKPGLPEGVRSALTSLTYNAGPKWMSEGLGAAIQKGDKEAAKKYFLAYNRAGGKPNPGLIARRQREVQWFDRITDADRAKLADAALNSDRMNLGMGRPEGEVQPTNQPLGDQFAQAPAFPSQPVPPQQTMPVPPAGPLETDAQLQARLRAAPAGQRQQIMEDYLKRAQGREFETTTGKGVVTPGRNGEQPTVSHTPSKTFPLSIDGVGIQLMPTDKGFTAILPGGEKMEGLQSMDPITKWIRDKKALDLRSSEKTKHYTEREEDIQNRALGASRNRQMLAIAKAMSNDPSFYSGTGADKLLNYSKIASYLTGNPNWSGSTEAFSKLIAGANIAGLEAFKGYGQIRNTEIELLREASGNLSNSPGAIQAIIEMNDRASQRLEEVGEKMRAYRKEHGKLDEGFDEELSKFYKDRPMFTDEEIKNYRSLFKTIKYKTDILPNGAIRRKKE